MLSSLIRTRRRDGDHYKFMARGLRLTASKLMVKKHRISKEWEVSCLLLVDGTARTTSLTENVQREAMRLQPHSVPSWS